VVAHQRSILAREGWLWLIGLAICGILVGWYVDWLWASPVAVLCFLAFLLFHDPVRNIPPLPLAVVAPVDGQITQITRHTSNTLSGEWQRISIKTNLLGAYTVRSPIEGTIHDVRDELKNTTQTDVPRGLWVRNEEQDDVVLLFPRYRLGLAPKTFVRYGERVGQGQRFAYLRLAACAEVYLPLTAGICVQEGDRVQAGTSVLAELAPK